MIDSRSADVDPHDLTPFVLLGLLSFARVVEREIVAATASGPVPDARGDDTVALAVLGALSIARSVRGVAERELPVVASSRAAAAPPMPQRSVRGMLR